MPWIRPVPPVWTHWIMASSDSDGTMAGTRCTIVGWGLSKRFIYLFVCLHVERHPQTSRTRPGPEEIVNLQVLLVQSSNWFGISSVGTVQFPRAPVCLESSFSSFQGIGVKCLRSVPSVQFIQFSSRTLPALIHKQPHM